MNHNLGFDVPYRYGSGIRIYRPENTSVKIIGAKNKSAALICLPRMFLHVLLLEHAMPITLNFPVRRLSQREFAEIAFEVMRHIFAMHSELGRFFDEKIYKRELAHRSPNVRLEAPVDITFDSFQKRCFLDVLVGEGGLFEFKAAESLSGRHRAQLMQYLMLCGLAHGKLINVRPRVVQHEFVNTHWQHADRVQFKVDTARLNAAVAGVVRLCDVLTALLRDLGTGLEVALYEEAVAHFFGGPDEVEADVAVAIDGRRIGYQRFRLIAPGVALKITGFDRALEPFEIHARRLLAHVDLRAIAWVNVSMKKITFTTLER
jgi:GxxExxY protein